MIQTLIRNNTTFLNAPQILCLPNELINPEGNSRWLLSSVKFKIEYKESTAYFWLYADKLSSWKVLRWLFVYGNFTDLLFY